MVYFEQFYLIFYVRYDIIDIYFSGGIVVMSLDNSVKVPIPEHGAVKRRMGDKVYIYYATAVYRNEKGQPTCDRVSIGRFDEGSGMLIPNRNYYEVYLKQSAPSTAGFQSCGIYEAFHGICTKLGLIKLVKRYFPEHWKEMLTVAQYMLSQGNVMYYLKDYMEEHKTALSEEIDDAAISRMFSELREEDRILFFREWLKTKKPKEYVAYDVTSVSSYSKHIEDLEWGYNRDKEKLPQINMGMYYGEESGLPLYYRIYPGSISDKAHLKYMVSGNSLIDNSKTRFLMDRGFYSAENLRYLAEEGCRFIIALPGNLKYCTELIKKHRDEIINHSEYRLGKGLPYGKAYETTDLGIRMKVHLFYDPEKAALESEALYELVERQENDLSQMKEPPEKKLHYDKYFYINRSKNGKLSYIRNFKAIDEQLAKCGFFLIAETDFRKTTAEILELYRRRDVIEKSFDDLKNELDMKRLRCHNEETAQGKIFVAFLSLIVRSYMLKQLRPLMQQNDYPFRKILMELDKIRCFSISQNAKPTLTNPLTKLQRAIFVCLEIPYQQESCM